MADVITASLSYVTWTLTAYSQTGTAINITMQQETVTESHFTDISED